MTDPYQVLGISPSATDDEVKAAYRKMAKQYHPDRNMGSEDAEKMMMKVNEAYGQIMDMRKNGGNSSYSHQGSGGTQDYYDPTAGFGGFGYRWGTPDFYTVRQLLNVGRYMEALQMLNRMPTRDAQWYYLSGRARQGIGDYISALNFARQAVNMEPGNAEYQAFLQEMNRGGQNYRQNSVPYGGTRSTCSNYCIACLLFNLCCRGGCGGGMRFCCI